MMKLRKYVSIGLLLVYCLAVGGAAYTVLSCRCVQWGVTRTHVCGGCCVLHADRYSSCESVKSVCCGMDHSTATDLYTATSAPSSERDVRIAVVDLPAALSSVESEISTGFSLHEPVSAPPFRRVETAFLSVSGLRAPPAFL